MAKFPVKSTAIAAIIIIALLGFVIAQSNKPEKEEDKPKASSTSQQSSEQTINTTLLSGNYKDYENKNIKLYGHVIKHDGKYSVTDVADPKAPSFQLDVSKVKSQLDKEFDKGASRTKSALILDSFFKTSKDGKGVVTFTITVNSVKK